MEIGSIIQPMDLKKKWKYMSMVILSKHLLKKMVRLRLYNIDSISDYPQKLILLRSIIENGDDKQ